MGVMGPSPCKGIRIPDARTPVGSIGVQVVPLLTDLYLNFIFLTMS